MARVATRTSAWPTTVLSSPDQPSSSMPFLSCSPPASGLTVHCPVLNSVPVRGALVAASINCGATLRARSPMSMSTQNSLSGLSDRLSSSCSTWEEASLQDVSSSANTTVRLNSPCMRADPEDKENAGNAINVITNDSHKFSKEKRLALGVKRLPEQICELPVATINTEGSTFLDDISTECVFLDDSETDELHKQLNLRFPDDACHFVRHAPGRYIVGSRRIGLKILQRQLVATLEDRRQLHLSAYLEELVLLGDLPSTPSILAESPAGKDHDEGDFGDASTSAAGYSSILLSGELSSIAGSSIATSAAPGPPPATPQSPSPRRHGVAPTPTTVVAAAPVPKVVQSARPGSAARPPRPSPSRAAQSARPARSPQRSPTGPTCSPKRSPPCGVVVRTTRSSAGPSPQRRQFSTSRRNPVESPRSTPLRIR